MYTALEIVRGRMFPFATSFYTVRNLIEMDRRKKNLLRASVMGKGTHTRYWIKGENIIRVLALWEDGSPIY